MTEAPERVLAARKAAVEAGFEYSCDDRVGRLLAVLAAGVPVGGRILELGTGAAVGTAWLVHGLAERSDVEIVTVEADPTVASLAQRQQWPTHVRFVVADAVTVLPSLGRFDLVFADAPGGKWERLDLSIGALDAGGFLLVDDMTPQEWWGDEQAQKQAGVRRELIEHPALASCELEWASGVILCRRRIDVDRASAPGA